MPTYSSTKTNSDSNSLNPLASFSRRELVLVCPGFPSGIKVQSLDLLPPYSRSKEWDSLCVTGRKNSRHFRRPACHTRHFRRMTGWPKAPSTGPAAPGSRTDHPEVMVFRHTPSASDPVSTESSVSESESTLELLSTWASSTALESMPHSPPGIHDAWSIWRTCHMREGLCGNLPGECLQCWSSWDASRIPLPLLPDWSGGVCIALCPMSLRWRQWL